MISWLSPILIFASFWDQFWNPFWLVLGSTLGAFGNEQVAKMSLKIDALIGIGKKRIPRTSGCKRDSQAGAGDQEGAKGGAKPPPWGGDSKEKKKVRKEEREI